MRLHDLKPAPGSTKDRKRLGRGNASGQGTTAGKGTKGQKARSGGTKAGFRGVSSRNQRMAKRRGFTNIFKTNYQVLNVGKLGRFESGATITPAVLFAAGLINREDTPIKLLGNGDLTVALNVEGVELSQGARLKIEAAGGAVTSKLPQAAIEEEIDATSGS
ncbi:MAG: 50S ribosomal protein L15 [Chloroflexota bacterium]|nr:50S ribosomal protein L15 [Chloroflexota bacterium]